MKSIPSHLGLLSLATVTLTASLGCGPAPGGEETISEVEQSLTVNNGSFELGNFTGTIYTSLSAGATHLTGWSVGGAGIDWLGSHTTAAHGTKSLDLNQLEAGSVSQSLDTVVGAVYQVNFKLAGNPICGSPVLKALLVSAGSQQAQFGFDTTYSTTAAPGWVSRSFRFRATSWPTTLTFTSQTPGSCGPLIDDVSVTEVCLPPSLVNGDFENGNFTGTLYTSLSAGETHLTGWSVGGAGIDWLGSHTQANNGLKSLDLNQMDAGSVSQSIATLPGGSYQVSFALAGNPVCSPMLKTLRVGAASQVKDFYFDATNSTTSVPRWRNQTFTFTANATSTALSFSSQTPGSACGPLVDTVSISCAL